MKLKICGINDADFAVNAAEKGVDYLGFIFHPSSPRAVTVERAKEIVSVLRKKGPTPRLVGVFVRQSAAEIVSVMREASLDVVQLHRRASSDDVGRLKASGYEVWTLAGGAEGDGVLFDSSHGDGETDFKKGAYTSILAGGIGLNNLSAALRLSPDVLDVNSSLETSPGVKSVRKLEEFFAARPYKLILAPLRGVTIRCFRETFAAEIAEAGFTEAVTPFITANPGLDPLKDREISAPSSFLVTPQFIGKDPASLRHCLRRIKSVGYTTADLNCGCPFPMVRNKGRGSGILKTPEILRQMLEVGCEEMGEGNFSIKARLGVERKNELLGLMPLVNLFPLRHLTVHARTAKQMYEGDCDWVEGEKVIAAAKVPTVRNGDFECPRLPFAADSDLMVGRSFVRSLGMREDAADLVRRYIESSRAELSGDRPVLGRIKELISYWKDLPEWSRRWNLIKICRSTDEVSAVI